MLKGTCINCGIAYSGWALSEIQHRICPKCGSLIKVAGYDKAEMKDSIRQGRVAIKEKHSAGE